MIAAALQDGFRFGEKKLALLIDPDKQDLATLASRVTEAREAGVDLFLVGGSLLMRDETDRCIRTIRESASMPVILFPGSAWQISKEADALLFLSLISGRNPDLLIGQQVLAAPLVSQTNLEVIPTGYMLVDGGAPTSASYISQTFPLPADKPDIAAATALAGAYLGLQLLYLDAGSGARNPVPFELIRAVRQAVRLPILVGGGIREPQQALEAARAGADIVVIGSAAEDQPGRLAAFAQAVHSALHLADQP